MSFVYESFIEENKYIQYTIDGEDYVYKIFGVFFDYDYNLPLRKQEDNTPEKTQEYLEQIEALNIYDFDIDVNKNDSLITNFCYIYDINFKETYELIKQNKYYEKIYQRINKKDIFKPYIEHTNKYIKERID